MKKPNIIVVGAGYAGIAFINNLDEECFRLANFTIINKNSYHYHSTMLHKIATAENSGKIMFDLREFLHPEIKIIQQSVVDIDEAKCVVTTEFSKFNYDYLICAAGFEKESFNLKGIKNAMFIDSYTQSARICEVIKEKFTNAVDNDTKLNIVVCGGGLTGIEFAASCANMLKDKLNFYKIDNSKFNNFNVHLISSTKRLLPMIFSEKLSQKTFDKLTKLGVNVIQNRRIESLEKNLVNLKNGDSIHADIIIWAAGVRGSSLISESEIENERGRVKVDEKLRAYEGENCFYIGDVSAVSDGNGGYFPPTAQIACEQGEYLAREFKAMLKNKDFNETFKFKSNGVICSIGHNYATAKVLGFEMSGFIPAFLKMMVEKRWNMQLLGFKGLFL